MKKGFTLSEVLITLGIVGIVAVLTVPGVMKNYKNRLYVAQLEKVYAQIADAAQAIMNEEHVDNFYETTVGQTSNCSNANNGICETGPAYFLTKYFKTIKRNCQKSDDSGCISTSRSVYKTINADEVGGMPDYINGNRTNYYCIQTTSGAAICSFFNPTNTCMSVLVDVNGMGEPNIAGRDIFSMDMHKNGTISDYGSECADNSFGAAAASCTKGSGSLYNAASGCLTSVIEAGWKMEY